MNKPRRFAYLAGLPRTGSTVLGTLLSQHPNVYSSRTSCLRDMMNQVKGFSLGESPYYNVKDPKSPCWAIMRGMLYGAYEGVSEEIVLEKDRGWSASVSLAETLTGERPKILSPVRRVSEIISSFVLISQQIGKQSKIEDELRLANRKSNPWALSRIIWERYVYANWRVFKTGYENDSDCFLLLDYDDIVAKPRETLGLVCTYLDIEPWAPATTGLVNPSHENDAVYGLKGLHTVRSDLKRVSPPPEVVLGKECCEWWDSQGLEFWKSFRG